MQIYMAGLRTAKEIRYFEDYHAEHVIGAKPLFENILFSIASVGEQSRQSILPEMEARRLDGRLKGVMLDSGGFQVAKGKITIDEMLSLDRRIYNGYPHFDGYFMPDTPVFATDNYMIAQDKVDCNVAMSMELFEQLAPEVQAKSIPILHLQNISQIDAQMKGYMEIIDASGMVGLSNLPIGGDKRKKVQLTVELLNRFPKLKIHGLGDGSARALLALQMIGMASVDTTAAHTICGNGNVIFPFIGNYHTRKINQADLQGFHRATRHYCPFCSKIEDLREVYNHRKVHNFLVYRDMSKLYENAGQEDLDSSYYSLLDKGQGTLF